MRIVTVTLFALLLASPASAAGWTAGMEEDEGGPVMAASVTAPDTGTPPAMLRLTCGDQVNLRYDPASGLQGAADEGLTLEFATADARISRSFVYEEMDGMFAAYVPAGDALIELLMAGSEVAVTESGALLPARTFTLAGSRAAIGKVIAAC